MTPPKDEPPSGRLLLWVMAALLVAAALVLVAVWPRRSPPRRVVGAAREAPVVARAVVSPLPDAAPPPASAAPVAPAPSSSALSPVDLFAGELPELLSMGNTVASRGAPLNGSRLKEIYDYGKAHPGDARPHLLLGLDSMNRGWFGFAVEHYERAQKEDPRARQDPRMLRDLVKVAGDKEYGARAAAALSGIFGPAAVPALEDAMAEASARGEAARADLLLAAMRRIDPEK